MAIRRGLEPLTSSVTGWHSNQLNYRTILFKFKKSWWAFRDSNPGPIGYEPTAKASALPAELCSHVHALSDCED